MKKVSATFLSSKDVPKDLIKLISCRCLDLTKGENEND